MLRDTVITIGLTSALFSCAPAYSQEIKLTDAGCTVVKSTARQILADLQQGTTQYQIMKQLNDRDFGKDQEAVKLYLQVNTSAFSRNIQRGFRVDQVLSAVERDCKDLVDREL